MSAEDNGNVDLKPTSSSNEDLSEYTDADESISAPTECLAEVWIFLMLYYQFLPIFNIRQKKYVIQNKKGVELEKNM